MEKSCEQKILDLPILWRCQNDNFFLIKLFPNRLNIVTLLVLDPWLQCLTDWKTSEPSSKSTIAKNSLLLANPDEYFHELARIWYSVFTSLKQQVSLSSGMLYFYTLEKWLYEGQLGVHFIKLMILRHDMVHYGAY